MKLHGQIFHIALTSIVVSATLWCSGALCEEIYSAAGTHALRQDGTAATADPQPVVYIFRKSKFYPKDAIPNISVDSVAVSQIYDGTYLKLTVLPGKHTVTASIGGRTASVDLDTIVGETNYLEVSVHGLAGRLRLALVAVPKEEALPAISKAKAINPIEPAAKITKAELKAENERLKTAASQPANSPSPNANDSAGSGATTAASAAPTPSSTGDLQPPASSAIPVSTRLTDEQIRAAIQKGIDNEDIPIRVRKTVMVRGSISEGLVQQLYILSDSDRITWAADYGSHDVTKLNRQGYVSKRKKKAGFSFSIEDAKSSAVLFGVVTIIVETMAPRLSMVAEWTGPGYHIALEADGKTIEALTAEEYRARAQTVHAGASVKYVIPWNYKAFMPFATCSFRADACTYRQVVFPAIEGVQKLTVVITNAKGQRREKQIDPKLFEEQ